MYELAALLSAFLWATVSIVYSKVHHIHFLILNAVQCIVAVPFLWLAASFFPFAEISTQESIFFLLSALVGIALADSGYFIAIKNLGASNTMLFFPLVPVFTLLLESLFLGFSVSGKQGFGMFVVLIGIIAYVLSEYKQEKLGEIWLGLAGGFLYAGAAAASEVLVKTLLENHHPFFVSAVRASIASVVLLPMASKAGSWPTGKNLFFVVVAGFLGIFVGMLLSAYAVSGLPASIATTLLSTTVIFGMLLGVSIGDRKGAGSWVGSIVTIIGVFLIVSA